jgi:uncharacterized protein YciI
MPESTEQAALIPSTIETCYVAFLRKGPAWRVLETPEEKEQQNRHLAFLKSLYETGIILVYGPTVDAPDDLRGLAVLKAVSPEEARRIMDNDPHVRAGHLVIDIVTWMADQRAWRERGTQPRHG